MCKKRKQYKSSIINATLFILLNVVSVSCWDSHTKTDKDSFYTISRAWDFIRFPLIKPYQGMKIAKRDQVWHITLVPENNMEDIRAGNVIKLSVIDSVIFAACGDSTGYNDTCFVKAAWHVFIPKRKKEIAFLTEEAFDKYIKDNKLPVPQWISPLDAWNQFNNTQSLPWLKK